MSHESAQASRMPSRRTLAKTALWTVPVVATAAAAPASAASPVGCTNPAGCPTVANHGYVAQPASSGCGVRYVIDGSKSSPAPNPGLVYTGTTTKTTILTPVLTFFFPVSGLQWTSGVSPWSALTSNGQTKTSNGVTYYGYSSTYQGAVPVTPGSTVLPYYFSSREVCVTPSPSHSFIARSSSVVNGQTVTTDSGVRITQ